jgi:peptide deformylase
LSFPEVYEQVQRSSKVKVRYQDVSGQTIELEADGLLAICLQHEIDHLDGNTMIDKLSRLKKDMVQRKLKKLGWL